MKYKVRKSGGKKNVSGTDTPWYSATITRKPAQNTDHLAIQVSTYKRTSSTLNGNQKNDEQWRFPSRAPPPRHRREAGLEDYLDACQTFCVGDVQDRMFSFSPVLIRLNLVTNSHIIKSFRLGLCSYVGFNCVLFFLFMLCGAVRKILRCERKCSTTQVSYNVSCYANKNLPLNNITWTIFFICSG